MNLIKQLEIVIEAANKILEKIMSDCVKSMAPTSKDAQLDKILKKMSNLEIELKDTFLSTSRQIPWETSQQSMQKLTPIFQQHKVLTNDTAVVNLFDSNSSTN